MRSDEFVSTDAALRRDDGFTIVEVLIAMLLIATMALGVATLFALSIKATHAARNQTSTATLAAQKMEQLRSLTWGFDTNGEGLPVSDTTSDLTAYPSTQNGSGLNPSPADSLERNSTGFVDFVDAGGAWVGTGNTPPGTAVYIRRWSIQPLPTNPNNTLVIQVLVTPITNEMSRLATSNPRVRMPGDTLLVTVKTRKAS